MEESCNAQLQLDAIQVKLLNVIFFASFEKKKIKVGDILVLSEIASPATLHAALQKLISKGLVAHKLSRKNRAKYLDLTEASMDRYTYLMNTIIPPE